MNLNQELQKQNNRLDKYRNKLKSAQARNDREVIAQFQAEIQKISQKVDELKGQKNHHMSKKASDVQALAFNRALTKAEQADMGRLKKTVRGLVVVHPMTALGREIGVEFVTGFAPGKF